MVAMDTVIKCQLISPEHVFDKQTSRDKTCNLNMTINLKYSSNLFYIPDRETEPQLPFFEAARDLSSPLD